MANGGPDSPEPVLRPAPGGLDYNGERKYIVGGRCQVDHLTAHTASVTLGRCHRSVPAELHGKVEREDSKRGRAGRLALQGLDHSRPSDGSSVD